MTYQIDQSGKIEQTEKNTVIAYANGNQYAVMIPKKLKRKIQEAFRIHGMTSLFIYILFSIGVFYLLKPLRQNTQITIDIEYPGKDKLLSSFPVPIMQPKMCLMEKGNLTKYLL